ncbi:MAG: hypothetical protein EXS17_03585 [Phycisphaerales bacterium]|nr:hypothetical protein [Phycisphaerales bacterium]
MQGTHTTSSASHSARTQAIVLAANALLIGALLSGCQKPLFPEKNSRSQFETYDSLRQQNQQLVIPDEFGNPQPALRARLTPQT